MADTKTYNLAIELLLKAQNFVQGQKQVAQEAAKAAGKMSEADKAAQSFGKTLTRFGAYAAGLFTVSKAIEFAQQGLQEFGQRERELFRFESQLKATGQAAGLTAKQLQDLSRQQAFNTLGDTKGVADAIGVLTTFRTVAGDTFTRTIALSGDMQEVFGSGLPGAATMLGKALENPIAGISALADVGVSFTGQQKEQIKQLQESGRLFEAQSVILGVLEAQFGGAAVAAAQGYAGAVHTANQSTAELAEAVGAKLAPAVKNVLAIYSTVTQGLTALLRENPLQTLEGTLENVAEQIEQKYAPRISKVQQLITQENERLAKLRAVQEKQSQEEIKSYLDDVANYRVALDRERLASAKFTTDQWIELENAAIQQIKALNEGLASTLNSIEDEIRARRRETMTEAGAQADIQAEIAEKFAQAQTALAAGDSEGARELAENIRSLTGQVEDVDAAEASLRKLQEVFTQVTAAQVDTQRGIAEVAGEQAGTVTVDADITAAEANLATLQQELAEIQQERVVRIDADIKPLKAKLAESESLFKQAFSAISLNPFATQMNVVGSILKRASGGPIPGYGGGDRIPALLEGGEYIVRKDKAAKFRDLLDHINFGAPLKFASGGSVPGGSSSPNNLGEFTWNINNGGRAARGTLIGDRNSMNGFLRALKELS
jgi:hypothetical protein